MKTRRSMIGCALAMLVLASACKERADKPAADGSSQRERPAAVASASPARLPEVKAFGALHSMMHLGKTAAEVHLNELNQPHVYAVGALSELRGEVTIVDSRIWLAYPEESGRARVELTDKSQEGAALLVSSAVPNWQKVEFDRDVPFTELDAAIEAMAGARGVDVRQRFALRIEGDLAAVNWHVIDGKRATPDTVGSHAGHLEMAVKESSEQTKAVLVGFFSKSDQGIITHMGSTTHIHIVDEGRKSSGHVDSVKVLKGATLWLPAAS